MNKLIAIGELLIDFQSIGYEDLLNTNEFNKKPGGAPANVAVQVSKLKQNAIYISRVGDDVFGNYLINVLRKENVNVDNITKDIYHSTPLAFVSFQKNGEREFEFLRKNTADLFINQKDVNNININKGDIFHFGSVALNVESSRKAHKILINKAKDNNAIISFDPNLRFNLWDDEKELNEIVNEFIPYCDLLKISDDELLFITGKNNEEDGIKYILEKGVKILLLSKGSKGASIYLANNKTFNSNGYKVNSIDTTGAGDSFLGAFLSKLLENKVQKNELLEIDYTNYLDFACKAAAFKITRFGAISGMGTSSEIIDYFKRS